MGNSTTNTKKQVRPGVFSKDILVLTAKLTAAMGDYKAQAFVKVLMDKHNYTARDLERLTGWSHVHIHGLKNFDPKKFEQLHKDLAEAIAKWEDK